jgi:hypothetical protein
MNSHSLTEIGGRLRVVPKDAVTTEGPYFDHDSTGSGLSKLGFLHATYLSTNDLGRLVEVMVHSGTTLAGLLQSS